MNCEAKRLGSYVSVGSKDEAGEGDCSLTLKRNDTIRPAGTGIKDALLYSNGTFLACLASFVILESQYLLLGGMAASYSGLPLHLSWDHQLESKAAFVIITILWQSLAIFPIQHLVNRVFSAEWHYRFNKMDRSFNVNTDKVSTLNSGIKEFMTHFFSKESSWTYRVALIISLILRLLTGIAPAAIGISTISTHVDITLNIAKMSVGSNDTEEYFNGVIPYLASRAAAITQLEQQDHQTFGFSIFQNYILAAPNLVDTQPADSASSSDISAIQVSYNADVVHFNFSCEWMIPESIAPQSVNLAGLDWKIYATPEMATAKYHSGVFPLLPITSSQAYHSVNETALSAYLFAQRDNSATIAFNDTVVVPTTSANLSSMFPDDSGSLFTRYAFLVCNPRPKMKSANIFVNPIGYIPIGGYIDVLELPPAFLNLTKETQISPDVSNIIFSTALLDATSRGESPQTLANSSTFLTTTSYSIFMDGDFNETFARTGSLDNINAKLNKCFRSASKAFTDGYRPLLNGPVIQTAMHPTTSVRADQQVLSSVLALSTSSRTFYVTTALVALVTVLTPFLYKGWKQEKDYPFTLSSLSEEGLLKKHI